MAKAAFRLRIYHDHLVEGGEAMLAAERRVIYCVAGDVELSSEGRNVRLCEDEGFFSNQKVVVRGGSEGACLWRWELVQPNTVAGEIQCQGIKSTNAGDYKIELDTSVKRLMRLDRVSFPLGGEALTHIHAAPGVRCQLTGSLLVDTLGGHRRMWPGDTWVEHGPDPVYARGSKVHLSGFVRVMIVPEEYKGRSTITYIRPDDKDKPKFQSYKRYLEEPISF
jgi:hypothetical protein